jgi:hypothetical protein
MAVDFFDGWIIDFYSILNPTNSQAEARTSKNRKWEVVEVKGSKRKIRRRCVLLLQYSSTLYTAHTPKRKGVMSAIIIIIIIIIIIWS